MGKDQVADRPDYDTSGEQVLTVNVRETTSDATAEELPFDPSEWDETACCVWWVDAGTKAMTAVNEEERALMAAIGTETVDVRVDITDDAKLGVVFSKLSPAEPPTVLKIGEEGVVAGARGSEKLGAGWRLVRVMGTEIGHLPSKEGLKVMTEAIKALKDAGGGPLTLRFSPRALKLASQPVSPLPSLLSVLFSLFSPFSPFCFF